MGQFRTKYRIGQISINRIVELLVSPFFLNIGFSFIKNLQYLTVSTGWGHADTSNNNRGVSSGGSYRNFAVAWVSTVPARLDYAPRSPENLCDAARRVCDDICLLRRCKLMRRHSTSCNPIINPRINCHGDDWGGPATQQCLLQISIASVCNLFLPSLVCSYLWISCRIAF